ncbi:MAG: DUF3134 domain-containing protein [cyanobacterium endosymbiont of Epithemia adnata isolate EadnSB Bon19]|jgi:hypothetical protein|uniref:DUF3134 domain-containing protein n=1 Tax=cyanobacterium endosymbiont of Epithemia turgida TaxID=718217 RepID=UPI0004D0FC8E|nr:DUF3134 domain-containing protein [cyanobacterium endosymbiont of Epithemia turgida]BAP17386.1 hypothetical protein ETSB_0539 [cyanobacterium endosymbiont of Epithemia turgida isolate EtSB Lake Yunoko]
MYNPSWRQEPRYEPAVVIPVKYDSSILDWLKTNDRLIPCEQETLIIPLKEDEEISELMDVDDSYDDIDLDED